MTEKKGMYINIIITEALCVAIVLASVLGIKYLFASDYKKLQKWYFTEITNDTEIQEVIE